MTTPIVFLDIDGVLNSQEFFRQREMTKENWRDLDQSCIKELNTITSASGARIVISSTWRLTNDFPAIIGRLKSQGVEGDIIGRTPRLGRVRGDEIFAWMQCQIEWPQFVILDDDSDMGHLMDWLVRTDPVMGLCRLDVGMAVRILNRPGWIRL